MRDVDQAWAYGSREIEAEANEDAMPAAGAFTCFRCLDDYPMAVAVEVSAYTVPEAGWMWQHSALACPECAGVESEAVS